MNNSCLTALISRLSATLPFLYAAAVVRHEDICFAFMQLIQLKNKIQNSNKL